MKKTFKVALNVFLSVTVFFVSSYLYLNNNLKKSEKTTDNKTENIPYRQAPENCGVLVNFPSDKSVLFYLDFEKEILYIININGDYSQSADYVGYPADKKFSIDYYALSMLLDRMGGLDFEFDDGFYRLTGIQVCEMLSTEYSNELSYKIICSFCKTASQTGISQEDFSFLLSNCDTDLTMPVCLNWCDYIATLFSNAVFVNREGP